MTHDVQCYHQSVVHGSSVGYSCHRTTVVSGLGPMNGNAHSRCLIPRRHRERAYVPRFIFISPTAVTASEPMFLGSYFSHRRHRECAYVPGFIFLPPLSPHTRLCSWVHISIHRRHRTRAYVPGFISLSTAVTAHAPMFRDFVRDVYRSMHRPIPVSYAARHARTLCRVRHACWHLHRVHRHVPRLFTLQGREPRCLRPGRKPPRFSGCRPFSLSHDRLENGLMRVRVKAHLRVKRLRGKPRFSSGACGR